MVVFELDGIEIDRCVGCGGTWLDAGELEMLTEMAGVRRGLATDALLHARGLKHGKRKCPRCRKKLQAIAVGETPPIELDRCPRGHGLWLDRGEMRGLIASFGRHAEGGEENALSKFFEDFYRHELNPNLKGA